MARRLRFDVEGGLYHLITRGNDRQVIFHSPADHQRFLSLLARQKERAGFFLYAYCLMSNHVHLLIERQAEAVAGVMQRLLTGYSQYYNRKYRRIGHVFQGRYKAIFCQSENYLGQLVRYIHLNPVRAQMVTLAEEYPYSSQRAYLGLEPHGIVDVDPVLRLFGNRREIARKHFAEYVIAGMNEGYRPELCSPESGDILGSEEFIDANIHRLGKVEQAHPRGPRVKTPKFNAKALIAAVESAFGMAQEHFCGPEKNAKAIMAKEILILVGREGGATVTQLAVVSGLDTSTVSRRCDAAKQRELTDRKLAYAKELVEKNYYERIAESQA